MINQQLPPFLNVVSDGVATVRVPAYQMTLNRVQLALESGALNGFTKEMITDIKLKLGVRTVYNVTGPRLDAINKYKGMHDEDGFLTIDFTERDAPTIQGKEIGGYDLSVLKDDLTIEVTIVGATSPRLSAVGWFTPPQGNALIHKILYFPASTAVGGKFPINFNPRGALVKRVHFFYAGQNHVDDEQGQGNLNRLEVKKNGLVVWDLTGKQARFTAQEYRKVPQLGLYTYDPIVDNNASGYLVTADATALEFNTFLTAGDAIGAYVELLDAPYNA